jgi:hydroxymethylglutaryl-CoA reductase
MIGQIQILNVPEPFAAKEKILAEKEKILALANAQCPLLVTLGGGAVGLRRSTTRAVVTSFIMIIIADFILTRILLYVLGFSL